MALPAMRSAGGRQYLDFSAFDTYGFWCKKTAPLPGVQANPRNRIAYQMHDSHFVLAALSVPLPYNYGAVFQSSNTGEAFCSELGVANSQPQARFQDKNGQIVNLTSPKTLVANVPAVLAMTSVTGAQRLRVNSSVVASSSASFAPGAFDQMLLGWGFQFYYPRPSFGGNLYGAIVGKGAPTAQELGVLERYLASVSGVVLT
jgi:hypothetical protein